MTEKAKAELGFYEKVKILYELMVSRGEKYIGDDDPENIWWQVLKRKYEKAGKGFAESIEDKAKKENISWQTMR